MPEATVLYSVTAVVVAGLVVWVLAVLKTAKEPWARKAPPGEREEPSAVDEAEVEKKDQADVEVAKNDEPPIDADSTAKATPVALASEARAKAAAEAKAEDAAPSEDDAAVAPDDAKAKTSDA